MRLTGYADAFVGQTPRRQDALSCALARDVALIDEHAWDALVSDNDFFNSHRWLAGLDAALGPAEVLTVQAMAGLTAGCALWSGDLGPGQFRLADLFAGLPGPWTREFLWLGGRRCSHNEIPVVAGRQREPSLRCLFDAALTLAGQRGCVGAVMPYMPLRAAQEVAAATGAATILHSAEAVIGIPAGGLPEMMSRWKKHDRVRSKAEIAAFELAGNRIEWKPIDESDEDMAAHLIALNRARHGSAGGDQWMKRMFSGQRRSGALDAAVAAFAKRGDVTTALTVFYRFGQTLHARYFGSDYAIQDNDFRYFVLSYYAAVNYAATHGCTQFCLSTSALQAKAKRGARIEPLAAVVLLADGRLPDSSAIAHHNRAFLGGFQRELGAHLSPEWQLVCH